MDELRTALIDSAVILLPVLAGLIAIFLRGYAQKLGQEVESRIGHSNFALLWNFADIFIRAAEQVAGLETDEQKKEFVFALLREQADNIGLEISDAQLNALIEGVYNRIKDELGGDDNSPVGFM